MVYNFLPFMVLPIYNVLAKIDDNTINAARDLGANNFQTLIHRSGFPLSIPGIISGITMVFVPALTTFVISNLLGGSKILLIGNVIEQEFTKGSNWHLGSGLSLVLMIFIFTQYGAHRPNTIKKERGRCILNETQLQNSLLQYLSGALSFCFCMRPSLTTDRAVLQPVQEPGTAGAVLPPAGIPNCSRMQRHPAWPYDNTLLIAFAIGSDRHPHRHYAPAMAINSMKRTLAYHLHGHHQHTRC